MTTAGIKLITVPAETRQLAREPMVFSRELEPYINWDALAGLRRALACDMRVSAAPDGTLVVSFFWPAPPEGQS